MTYVTSEPGQYPCTTPRKPPGGDRSSPRSEQEEDRILGSEPRRGLRRGPEKGTLEGPDSLTRPLLRILKGGAGPILVLKL